MPVQVALLIVHLVTSELTLKGCVRECFSSVLVQDTQALPLCWPVGFEFTSKPHMLSGRQDDSGVVDVVGIRQRMIVDKTIQQNQEVHICLTISYIMEPMTWEYGGFVEVLSDVTLRMG